MIADKLCIKEISALTSCGKMCIIKVYVINDLEGAAMGRQINYYMEHESFLRIAQLALDCGCEIVKQDLKARPAAVVRTRDISVISSSDWILWFYVPEAGKLGITTSDSGERVDHGYTESGSALIEAGVSLILEDEKIIRRNRLYVISGYYDSGRGWIPRPKCVDAVYGKLMRQVKKLTEYNGSYYVTEYCAGLHSEGYKLM